MLFFFTKENIEKMKVMESKFPNDMEFGNKLRSEFQNEDFIMGIPNDQDLAKRVRKILETL